MSDLEGRRERRAKEDDIKRILSTHAGSIIRAQRLPDFLVTIERGEPVDEDAYADTLSSAVTDVVRRQSESGSDVVDHGEMGKSSWITYLYERTSVIEPRMVETEGGRVNLPSRDRLAFPSDRRRSPGSSKSCKERSAPGAAAPMRELSDERDKGELG